jgi:hypothetical protein
VILDCWDGWLDPVIRGAGAESKYSGIQWLIYESRRLGVRLDSRKGETVLKYACELLAVTLWFAHLVLNSRLQTR